MTQYAIIHTGGKQYRVSPGDHITVEKLTAEPGSTVEFDHVLAVSGDGGLTVGQPTVAGARVVAEVAQQGKGDKVVVFKYKRKVRYRVKSGHRQQLTELAIKEIVGGDSATARARS
ncbi:MAG: 50S ribosomal protein L21 [SAR202 cluster bacterium]|nr:50S ribosomal protein L21 [SAR202 cluster bacterium]